MAEVAQNLFAVVKFLKDSSHDFVPVNWLTQSGENYSVKFPKLKTSKVVALQTNAKSKPDAVWPEWEVRVVRFYGQYQSFQVKPVVDKNCIRRQFAVFVLYHFRLSGESRTKSSKIHGDIRSRVHSGVNCRPSEKAQGQRHYGIGSCPSSSTDKSFYW